MSTFVVKRIMLKVCLSASDPGNGIRKVIPDQTDVLWKMFYSLSYLFLSHSMILSKISLHDDMTKVNRMPSKSNLII